MFNVIVSISVVTLGIAGLILDDLNKMKKGMH